MKTENKVVCKVVGKTTIYFDRKQIMQALNQYWIDNENCCEIVDGHIVRIEHPNMAELETAHYRICSEVDWARDGRGCRDFVSESYQSAKRQSKYLQGVDLRICEYQDLVIPTKSLIYCDPPYAGTSQYKVGDFDSGKFWVWIRAKVKEGHTVFVSEYNAPADFICIFDKNVVSYAGTTRDSLRTEKLFIHQSQKRSICSGELF